MDELLPENYEIRLAILIKFLILCKQFRMQIDYNRRESRRGNSTFSSALAITRLISSNYVV